MLPVNPKNLSADEQQFFKNIGFKIQFERKKKELSQEQLAERAGLATATIGHIEAPHVYGLSLTALYRIAHALEVDPYKLLQFD
jgi:transcriptional regulator with XRE-family HTH domain